MKSPADTHGKSIGYLLWIFGFTGSHRFYLGGPVSGRAGRLQRRVDRAHVPGHFRHPPLLHGEMDQRPDLPGERGLFLLRVLCDFWTFNSQSARRTACLAGGEGLIVQQHDVDACLINVVRRRFFAIEPAVQRNRRNAQQTRKRADTARGLARLVEDQRGKAGPEARRLRAVVWRDGGRGHGALPSNACARRGLTRAASRSPAPWATRALSSRIASSFRTASR